MSKPPSNAHPRLYYFIFFDYLVYILELTLCDGSWLHQKDDLHTFVAEIQLKVNEKLLAGRIIYCCLPNFEQFFIF